MLCIIQARLSSKRLPSKMFKKILNKTLIDRIIYQISKSKKIKKIIIATSTHRSDDLLENYCKKKKLVFIEALSIMLLKDFMKFLKIVHSILF